MPGRRSAISAGRYSGSSDGEPARNDSRRSPMGQSRELDLRESGRDARASLRDLDLALVGPARESQRATIIGALR